MRALRSTSPLLGLLGLVVLATGGCSFFDPNVGPARDASAAVAEPACSLGASGYGTSFGAPSGQAAMNDFCTADGGTLEGACDLCEATSCCGDRVACYTDQTCSCADKLLDSCLTPATGSPDASPSAAAVTACFGAFVASGSIAETRYQCLQASCKAACGIP